MTDRWTDRLSDYLDGHLPDAERRALEEHLAGCPTCRVTVDELRHVVNRAHAAVDQPLTTDLWGGIAARIGASGTPAVYLGARRARRSISLTVPQLALAASVLLAVGAGLTVVATRPGVRPDALASAPTRRDLGTVPVGLPSRAEVSYETAVRELEEVLDAGRDRLSPKTITVLERNLARIDVAIEEARAALNADPANAYLSGHLANTMQQKLALLQQATMLATAAS